jgi:hypothetical protein
LTFEVFDPGTPALGGKALRKQVTVRFFGKNPGPKMDMLIYLPAGATKPVPLFLTLNFSGNHRIVADPAVKIGEVWDRGRKQKLAAPDTAWPPSTTATWSRISLVGCGTVSVRCISSPGRPNRRRMNGVH